jgi:hypothetical protein
VTKDFFGGFYQPYLLIITICQQRSRNQTRTRSCCSACSRSRSVRARRRRRARPRPAPALGGRKGHQWCRLGGPRAGRKCGGQQGGGSVGD